MMNPLQTYFAMNQKIQHIVSLPTHLQTSFDPIQLRRLEELRRLQLTEQVLPGHRFLRPSTQLIQHKALQKFLV
jgi:hypothetical protein